VDKTITRTLLDLVEGFREAFTEPGFRNFVVLFVGWVMTQGDHAVTQALVVTAVAERVHWERYHRFFSRGAWKPDELGHLILLRALKLHLDFVPVRIAIDDTLAPKKGPHLFGLGTHIDAVRSTKKHKVFCFGHCWVTLALLVRVPFSSRAWALPVLFRLYRTKKECANNEAVYKKKTELARELIILFASWVGQRRIELAADSGYCNNTVTKDLPASVVLFGSMRPDAVLTSPPPPRRVDQRGRTPLRGEVLPKPEQLARDDSVPWQWCRPRLYGQTTTVFYKTLCAQWYRACGPRLLRIVVVKAKTGTVGLRVFFSTDANLSVRQVLETYSGRWSLEVAYRNLKQMLGFADSSARKEKAVERVAPFVGLVYTTLVVWAAEGAFRSPLSAPPVRPWYRHKRGLSFADVLRTGQRALLPVDVLDPVRSLDNLHLDRPLPHAPVISASSSPSG
jgi:hypothetical protein